MIMRIAFQIFMFIMICTCWRKIIMIGVYLVQTIAQLVMQLIDAIEEKIERMAYGRKG